MAHGGVRLNVHYQGLAGAFSDAAAAALFPDAERIPQRTFAEVFAALAGERTDAAVVPVENSHAGAVADVYDLLRSHTDVRIVAEAVVRVRYCLLGAKGATLATIRKVRSHPQSLAQCDEWLRTHGLEPEVAFDNAGAAAEVAAAADPTVAALASRRAATRYGLTVLAEGIETASENFTRFFAICRDPKCADAIPKTLRTGAPKTSLVYATANLPGALTRSLQPFATAGLQLSKIESRPSRAAPWDYVFYLDFEGDPKASPAREALALMKTCCAWIQELGTYPAATKVLEPD